MTHTRQSYYHFDTTHKGCALCMLFKTGLSLKIYNDSKMLHLKLHHLNCNLKISQTLFLILNFHHEKGVL